MTQKSLIVLGVTDDRKPRAARFELKDEAAVRRAAAAMNMRCGIAKSTEASLLASKIVQGKIFESGVGLVPLVKVEVYYKLQEMLSFDETWNTCGVISGRGQTAPAELVKAADELWGAVKVGSVILAFDGEDQASFGWGAAVVIAVNKETLDCRWRDWPETKPFKMKRQLAAMFRPDVCP